MSAVALSNKYTKKAIKLLTYRLNPLIPKLWHFCITYPG